MVNLRDPVRDWVTQVFDTEALNEMQTVAETAVNEGESMKTVAEREGERVFGTSYTIQDYEDDLTHHEQQMKEAESRFEHFNDIRNDHLEDAKTASGLTRKRCLAKAQQRRQQAFKYVKLFVAHLEKFQQKLDELTAYETKTVSADANTNVDLDETAEAVNEQLIGNTSESDTVEREEADKAVERELSNHSLDDKVRQEEEALRQMNEEGVSAEEVGLGGDVDDFLEEELGGQTLAPDEEEQEDEDQLELDW